MRACSRTFPLGRARRVSTSARLLRGPVGNCVDARGSQSETSIHRPAYPRSDRSFNRYVPFLPLDPTRELTISPYICTCTLPRNPLANNHNCPKVSDDALSYLALALRERLLSVVNSSIHARNHRFSSSVTRPPGIYADGQTPMWAHAVKRDVRKQLSAIEKVEREEEARIRRERHERMENPGASSSTTAAGGASNGASGEGAGGSGGGGGDDSATGKKRKRAKEMGPGVTAKNMSEETRKKLVDDAASRAFGGSSKKYAWMTATPIPGAASGAGASTATAAASNPSPTAGAGGGGGALPKPTAGAQTGPLAYPRPTAGVSVSGGGGGGGGGGGWMRAQPPAALRNRAADDADPDGSRTLTLLDVEFAVEREKGHGGGRGSARGW